MNRPSIFQGPHYHFHAILAVTALACGGLAAAGLAVRGNATAHPKVAVPAMPDLKETSNTFAAITKNASPAVVYIEVEKRQPASEISSGWKGTPGLDDELLKRFFGDRLPHFGNPQFQAPQLQKPRSPRHAIGNGSGFIISKDGYVLTNNHVVGGADRLKVTLTDGREFDAQIVGADQRSDVAVIKIDATDLPTLHMGNSDDLAVGEWVLAVGSPFGLNGTVTSGIVSAKGRSSVGIADYENFIQTDAAINPGNSGGPLLNLDGEAIGINTAIFSRSGGNMGIGFAIPINMARKICDQLIENGSVTRGYLGIAIQQLTADLAKSFELDQTTGVLVGDVTNDSPAQKAGLQGGDVIVEFAGVPVTDLGAFRNCVASTEPGTDLKMIVLRDGKRVTLDVTVGTLPSQEALAKADVQDTDSLGMSVQPLTDELADKFGYRDEQGVVVTQVETGSAAALAGIQPGALIKEVNRKPVTSMEQFKAAAKKSEDNGSVLLRIRQGSHSRYVVLNLRD